ncbi:PfkB family carbohydrate kinase [Roseovarius sp.]|uniref:PfkB family carbohydrate kinase n=1 Tax=Roseovarius sp. TaxID=1486281 RepID=UPI003A980B9D
MITVIGGTYGERCGFPIWDQTYGSAGRAAAALAVSGEDVELHTALAATEESDVTVIMESLGVKVHSATRADTVSFEYLTPLSDPAIYISQADLEGSTKVVAEASDVVAYGMIEADVQVVADRCVYDPQSPSSPKLFSETGSTARELVIILNRAEASKLMGDHDPAELAKKVRKADNAVAAIVKDGINGCWISTVDDTVRLPAYRASSFFPIGSGDFFVASFSYAWYKWELSFVAAAEYAAKSTAHYVESRNLQLLPTDSETISHREECAPRNGNIYLAAPFREIGQRWMVDNVRRDLAKFGMQVFSPVHDIGHGTAEEVVAEDLAAIRNSDQVFAILNGSSPGTVFEAGYAAALEIPTICLATNMRDQDLKLPVGSGCSVYSDYASAIFAASVS